MTEEAGALLARQAIVDAAEHVVGYELLYRGPRRPDGRPVSEADATSEVIWNAWMELGRAEVAGAVPVWLNVGSDYLRRTPTLPVAAEDVVLELIECDAVTPELVTRVKALRAADYRIALDDFAFGTPAEALLPFANVVKLDVLALGVDGTIEAARRLRTAGGVQTVAEKVETREAFERLREAGLLFFQGWFYEKARRLTARGVPLRAIEAVKAVTELLALGEDLEAIEAIVSEDAGLAYRLVRLANSGFYAAASPVDSVHAAMTRVGVRAAREWLTMMTLHGLSDPANPVLALGLSRARLCAALAGEEDRALRDRCFLVGLFSVLDALIGPLEQLLAEAPVSPVVAGALLHRAGREGAILDWAVRMQRGVLPEGADATAAAHATVEAEAWAAETLSRASW